MFEEAPRIQSTRDVQAVELEAISFVLWPPCPAFIGYEILVDVLAGDFRIARVRPNGEHEPLVLS